MYTKDGVDYWETGQINVNPGDTLQGHMAFLEKIEDKYRYRLEFTGSKYWNTGRNLDMPCPLNTILLCVEPYTTNYLDLPPDPLIKMRDISVTVTPHDGLQPILEYIDWKFSNNGVVTPSKMNGAVISHANGTGEVDFYFR